MFRVFSITAPDEPSAQDLAAGGLAMFRPVVSGRRTGWHVRITAEGADWPTIEAMVAAWLRRKGIAAAIIEVGGVATTVSAQPAKRTSEVARLYRGLPEDSF